MTPQSTHKVVQFHETGPIDVLKYESVPTPEIKPTEVLVKNKYAGVNYIEAYFRTGLYPATLPYVLGREASGTIVKVGDEVKNYQVGDKIAYLNAATFAQYTALDASKVAVLKLDKDSSDEKLKLYGASLVQGLTAITLINEAYSVKEGDFILVTAAAGGVGLLLNQLLSKVKKAHVIALCSTQAKLDLTKKAGAEYFLNSSELTQEEQIAKILEITGGKGVAASFDSVGKDTAELSLAVVARKGTFVSFGNASGAVPPLSLGRLSPKNLKVVRPQVFGYITTPEEFKHYSDLLLTYVNDGTLHFDITKTYPLEDYKTAASDLEGRKTTGKLVLEIPQ
ncbi:hypothetical protein CANARDRAFT_175587 [[Candida] arabinofermentans NRRL YB-2248]|uniref:Probable quinone oxidoreductase n=1 Tax=[Candida] arabinofermentans NRRL YB-2248 TaxID=983967 RepID=A0A1E4T295_9ASCO|nr:hypothetical protein CANARDRAFT_175587 [[Candida] arabinofermentans NRRL YB-2248]